MIYFRILLSLAMITMLTACKKTVKPLDKEPDPDTRQPDVIKFVPVKFASDRLILTLTYIDNTALLETISGSDNYSVVVTYKNDLPHRLDQFERKVRLYFNDYFYNNGILTSVSKFTVSGFFDIHQGNYQPRYNESKQVIGIKTFDQSFDLVSDQVFTYNAAGNRVENETTDQNGNKSTIAMTYDNKNGIFKDVPFADLLFLDLNSNLFWPGDNNILSLESTLGSAEKMNFTYIYDEVGYPSQMSIMKNNSKQTFKITYKAVKQ